MEKNKELLLSTAVLSGGEPGVDSKQKRITGAKVIQLGQLNDTRGEFLFVDQTSLEQVVMLGNAPNKGARVRFNHPQPGEDMARKHLGRAKNFRVEGDAVRADLWLAQAAFSELAQNVGGYVLQLVEEDSEALGLSVHTVLDIVAMRDEEDDDGHMPLRFKSLTAVDVVDQPAATRGGMFSKEEQMSEEKALEELMAGAASGPGKPVVEEPAEEPKEQHLNAAPVEEQPVAEEAPVEEEKKEEECCGEEGCEHKLEASAEVGEDSLMLKAQPYLDAFGEEAGASLFLRGVGLQEALLGSHKEKAEKIEALEAEVAELKAQLASVEGVVESFEEVQADISNGLSAEKADKDPALQLREEKIAAARKQGLSPGAASFAAVFSK